MESQDPARALPLSTDLFPQGKCLVSRWPPKTFGLDFLLGSFPQMDGLEANMPVWDHKHSNPKHCLLGPITCTITR